MKFYSQNWEKLNFFGIKNGSCISYTCIKGEKADNEVIIKWTDFEKKLNINACTVLSYMEIYFWQYGICLKDIVKFNIMN